MKTVSKITLGPEVIDESDSGSYRDIIVLDRCIGRCYEIPKEYQDNFYTHEITFARKELRRDIKVERATSYEKLLEILRHFEDLIVDEVLDLENLED